MHHHYYLHTPILPQESLSEYGSGWEWDENAIYAHVFDQTNMQVNYTSNLAIIDDTPIRYANDGTKMDYCVDDYEVTNGQTLFSGALMKEQKSCRANVGNAGNWYSWPAATAGGSSNTNGYNEKSSVCPRGWQLTVNAETDSKSYYSLIVTTYNISDSNDSKIRTLPFSFARSDYYLNGNPSRRGSSGYYYSASVFSSRTAYYLEYSSSNLIPQNEIEWDHWKNSGFSLRCAA